jgi:pilus assembly protein CpaF
LNTGHSGSFSTIHANGPVEALDWLSALALMAIPEMSYEIVQRQVMTAFQLVVHLERAEAKRRIASISRIEKYNAGAREFVIRKVA